MERARREEIHEFEKEEAEAEASKRLQKGSATDANGSGRHLLTSVTRSGSVKQIMAAAHTVDSAIHCAAHAVSRAGHSAAPRSRGAQGIPQRLTIAGSAAEPEPEYPTEFAPVAKPERAAMPASPTQMPAWSSSMVIEAVADEEARRSSAASTAAAEGTVAARPDAKSMCGAQSSSFGNERWRQRMADCTASGGDDGDLPVDEETPPASRIWSPKDKPPALDDVSKSDVHVVGVGETLSTIAMKHGMSRQDLMQLNRLVSPSVHPGQRLRTAKPKLATSSSQHATTAAVRIQRLHRQRTSPDKVENARQQWIALSLQEGNLERARALGWDGDPSFGASPDAAVAPAAACPAAAAPNSMAPLGALGSKLGGRLSFRRAGGAQRADETAPPCARLPAQRSASLPPVPPSALDTFIGLFDMQTQQSQGKVSAPPKVKPPSPGHVERRRSQADPPANDSVDAAAGAVGGREYRL